MVQDLVLAVLVEREPIKLAPNSAQIPALLAMTKQNIYQMRQAVGPAASAAASAAAQSAPEVSNGSAAQAPAQQAQVHTLAWHSGKGMPSTRRAFPLKVDCCFLSRGNGSGTPSS